MTSDVGDSVVLLDANVLIALVIREHEHHPRATAWAASVRDFAVCPVVEGSLVRYLMRIGESAASARLVLDALSRRPGHVFWPDSVPYADVDLDRLIGHRQVTDAYLVALARRHGAKLATLDEGLATTWPEDSRLVPPADAQS